MVLNNYQTKLQKTLFYNSEFLFLIILIATIFFSRLIYFLFNNLLKIETFNHFFIGVILLLFVGLTAVFNSQYSKFYFYKLILLAIGFGFIVDQYIFLIINEATGQGYWEYESYFGTFILFLFLVFYTLILIYIRRKKFLNKSNQNIINYFSINRHKDLIFLYFIVILTVLVSRILVILLPNVSFFLNDFEIHHILTGVFVLLISIITIIVYRDIKINKYIFYLLLIITGFGIGLIIDEFTFLLYRGVTNEEYWSNISIYGLILLFICFSIFYFSLYLYIKKNRIAD